MLTKLRTFASLYRELGLRWSAFRVAYAFRLRTGLVRIQMPQYKWEALPLETWLKQNIPSNFESYTNWRKNNLPKFFDSVGAGSSRSISWNPQVAIDEANKILSGEIKYFSHNFAQTGFPPNWHKDPVSGIELDSTKHWSQLSADSNVDIKFIWEANRFSFIYTFVRAYVATKDEIYAESFWKAIEDWAKNNPPNTGANWMDGQEIALRLMAWTFGYYAFFNSPSSTPERVAQFTTLVAAQTERIYKNIDYAISTRSNHTISEAFGLWIVGLLFPELKNSEKYFSLGRDLLEHEAATQIFPDGSYSMYSLNYHRFILHLYLYAIRLSDINAVSFSIELKKSVANSIDYLSQLIDPQTGQMPVYGSNDGALVLPLNNCDFTDYRPLLQLGSYIMKEKRMFESGEWDEDIFWLYGNQSLNAEIDTPQQIAQNFSNGGVYVLRGTNSKAFIRCTNYQSRPSHADQLHVDVWMGKHNIACDAGTYLYSGQGIWRNGLAHTSAHNTVTVDNKDQMNMASRFTWTNWAMGKVLQHTEKTWQGEHDGYKPISHKRSLLALESDRWLIVDELNGNESHHYALHWLLSDAPFEENKNSLHLRYESSTYKVQTGLVNGEGKFSIVRTDSKTTRGWRSRYYGHKEPAISLILEANQPKVTFWSFFGFENDQVELENQILKINSTSIDLNFF